MASTADQMQPCKESISSLSADVECLQRAVEGRASSDEEEEDRVLRKEGLSETKSISRVHSCGKGFAIISTICLKRQAEASLSSLLLSSDAITSWSTHTVSIATRDAAAGMDRRQSCLGQERWGCFFVGYIIQ